MLQNIWIDLESPQHSHERRMNMANGLTPGQIDVLSTFAQQEPRRMENLLNIIEDGGEDLNTLKNKILAIHMDRKKKGINRTHD